MFPFRKFSSKILIFEFLVSRVVLAVRGWFWPTWDCLAVRTGHFPRTDGTSPDSPWSVSIRSSHQYVWVGFSWTDGPVRTVLVRPDSTDGWSDQHISTYGAFFTYWWDQSGQSMVRLDQISPSVRMGRIFMDWWTSPDSPGPSRQYWWDAWSSKCENFPLVFYDLIKIYVMTGCVSSFFSGILVREWFYPSNNLKPRATFSYILEIFGIFVYRVFGRNIWLVKGRVES